MRRDVPIAASLVLVLLALVPAYQRVLPDAVWRGPVVMAGLLALGAAVAVRALRGGALLALLVSLVSLGAFTYVTALPDVGLLPDGSSWTAFVELLQQAAVDLREQRAPAATTAGFVVALTTGTWIVLHVAHEVLIRMRSPGAALVPPLVLWTLPLAVPMDGTAGTVGRALPFLAACGLVLLLANDTRRDAEAVPELTGPGLALGSTALGLAVIAPLLLPSYDAAPLLDLSPGGDPRGYQPIVDVSERLQQPEERDVLTVRTDRRSYLRLAGLDSFDGNTWRLGPSGESSYRPPEDSLFPGTRTLPPEEPALTTTSVRSDIEVLDLANIYVPTPYQPTDVGGPLRDEVLWSTEGGFLATWNLTEAGAGQPRVGVTQGVEYRIDAEIPVPSADELRDVEVDPVTQERWTQLPGPSGLEDVARQVYDDAGAHTTIDRALALQRWFTEDDRFTYDLDVPPLRGEDALRDFVLSDRVGYCEYFATAMAVMLRETGIPARVAVGFLPGEVTLAADPSAGRDLTENLVRTTDAHAWVEVLFPGYGWITFEPTPRDDGAQIAPTEDNLLPERTVAEQAADPDEDVPDEDDASDEAPEDEDTDEADAPQEEPEPDATDGDADAEGAGTGPGWWWSLAALLGLGAVAAVLRARPGTAPGTDPVGRVLTAQRAVLVAGQRYGVARGPHETLTEVGVRWQRSGRLGPDVDVDRFAVLAQRAAFLGELDPEEAAEAEGLGSRVEASLRASASRQERAVAPLRPGSARVNEAVATLRARVARG